VIKIELSKYPVIYNGNEYKVDIIKEHVAFSEYQWEVIIYKFVLKTFPFGKTQYKWKRVYAHLTGWGNYKKWLGKYVELAQQAVINYEESIKSKITMESLNNQGIKQWEEWDGVIK